MSDDVLKNLAYQIDQEKARAADVAGSKYQLAVTLWLANLSVNEIARRMKVSRGVVLGLAHRNRQDFPFRSDTAKRRARR